MYIDFTYNPNGSLTKETYIRAGNSYKERNFTYDYEERLQQVEILDKSTGVPQLDTTGRVNFAYDDFGNRIKKQVEGGDTKYYLNRGLDLLAELDSQGNITKSYVYGVDLIGTIDSEGNFKYTVQDSLGSTRVLTDDQGNKITEKTYDPYGSVEYMESSGALSGNLGEAVNIDENIGFTNQEQDPETGLIYMNARYYNPVIGRFITEDLYKGDIGDAKSLNHYTYAANNPLKYIDPTGMWTYSIGDDGTRYAESCLRDDGQIERISHLVQTLFFGYSIEEMKNLTVQQLLDRNQVYFDETVDRDYKPFGEWDFSEWNDPLYSYGEKLPWVAEWKGFKEGRKINIEWMIDRTYNFRRWLERGAEEMINRPWYQTAGSKLRDMVNTGHDYDIKQKQVGEIRGEYYYNSASDVIIGDTLVMYDKPNSFLLGYIAAAGDVTETWTKIQTGTYQSIFNDLKFYKENPSHALNILVPWSIDLQEITFDITAQIDEEIDEVFISAGYNFYKTYGTNFTDEALGGYFNIANRIVGINLQNLGLL